MTNLNVPESGRNNDDLAEALEKLIEEEPQFDDRLRKQLERAREICRRRPLDSRTSDYYDLCLDTLTKMHEFSPVGLEWHFMKGTVQMFLAMRLAGMGNLADAGKYFKFSQKSFEESERPVAEALAYVGLARSYHGGSKLNSAHDSYEQAIIKLDSLHSADFGLRQLRKRLEVVHEEVEKELVEPRHTELASPPPTILDHGKPIPVVGNIKAGYPGLLVEDNVEDWMVVDQFSVHGAEFCLQVKGDSMKEAGILSEDYVIIRPMVTDVRPAEIAAVQILRSNNEVEGVLKHVYWKSTHWCLKSDNSNVPSVIVAPDAQGLKEIAIEYLNQGEKVESIEGTVAVVGKVVAVIRVMV